MDPEPRRAWAGWYLVVQAAATALWWVWMLGDPAARQIFFLHDADFAVLRRFAAPDLLVFGGGSLTAGVLLLRRHPWARLGAWLTMGAAAYATVGAFAANWPIGQRPVADGVMLLTLLGTAWALRAARDGP